MSLKKIGKTLEKKLQRFVPFRKIRKLLQENITIQYDILHRIESIQISSPYTILEHPKYQDEKRLERFGYSVYSQNDEDGIIAEIFRRIGITNHFFIEFGVQDGLECNSHFLLLQGWSGVFIEGSAEYCKQIQKNFETPIRQGRLTLLNEFITAENINDLFVKTQATAIKDIDLLSIDIDGNDYHIFKAIHIINPRVIIIEMNAKFPPPAEWIMPYNPSHIWDGTDNQGASLESLTLLGKEKGYRLVATNINGTNAFFVRDDLCGDKFPQDCSAANLYNAHPIRIMARGHKNVKHLENACLYEKTESINN